jgi:recombination protein RecT
VTEGKQLTIADTLRKMQPEFQAALPPHISPERFTRVAVTAVNSNPDLLKPDVDKRSIYAACMKAAQDGLIIDNREAALVIFKGRAQYMPMIDGIMKLVRNSGEISVWSVHVVKEHDKFDYELGDDEFMKHKPALTNRGKTIGAYSIVTPSKQLWLSQTIKSTITSSTPSIRT